jgi:hypothetical protein
MKVLWGAAAVLALMAGPAGATTYVLPDIGTFPDYTDSNTSDTFSGNGFVGEYNTVANGVPAYAHLLGVEATDYSRTIVQVDLSGLTPVSNATLSFLLLDGGSGPHGVAVTGWGGTGALSYTWDPPGANYGGDNLTAIQGANSVDVTNLVNAAIASGDPWLDLELQGTDSNDFMWTYTWAGDGFGPDRADMRLDVTEASEPASLALLGVGLAGLGLARRRKSA